MCHVSMLQTAHMTCRQPCAACRQPSVHSMFKCMTFRGKYFLIVAKQGGATRSRTKRLAHKLRETIRNPHDPMCAQNIAFLSAHPRASISKLCNVLQTQPDPTMQRKYRGNGLLSRDSLCDCKHSYRSLRCKSHIVLLDKPWAGWAHGRLPRST